MLGPGRVGRALSARLEQRGYAVHLGRDPALAAGCELALLAVPDRAIASLASALPDGPWVVHLAGGVSLDALGARERAVALHPLMTFRTDGDPGQFDGAYAAVSARDAAGQAYGEDLARELGLIPFPLRDAARPLYHAAAVLASNSIPVIVEAAVRCATLAGLEPDQARTALAPLVRRSAENALAGLPDGGLTGPVARGDAQTVERQLAALGSEPALAALYRALARAAVALLAPEREAALAGALEADPC